MTQTLQREIERLQREAIAADDVKQQAICAWALAGDADAIADCRNSLLIEGWHDVYLQPTADHTVDVELDEPACTLDESRERPRLQHDWRCQVHIAARAITSERCAHCGCVRIVRGKIASC